MTEEKKSVVNNEMEKTVLKLALESNLKLNRESGAKFAEVVRWNKC